VKARIDTKGLVKKIHVWRDYDNRHQGCSMHLKHGAKINVIKKYKVM